jgi:hypothetical protein
MGHHLTGTALVITEVGEAVGTFPGLLIHRPLEKA